MWEAAEPIIIVSIWPVAILTFIHHAIFRVVVLFSAWVHNTLQTYSNKLCDGKNTKQEQKLLIMATEGLKYILGLLLSTILSGAQQTKHQIYK